MNTIDVLPIDAYGNVYKSSWVDYLSLGLNFLIIALSITKQFVNSKNHSELKTTVKALSTTANLQTEQVELNIPDHLKSSVHEAENPK